MLGEIYYSNKFLDENECSSFINYFKEKEAEAVRGTVGYPPNAKTDFNRRVDKIVFVNPQEKLLQPVIDKVASICKQVNEDIFLFDVNWDHYKDPKTKSVFISQYDGAEKGYWEQHQCVNWISNYMQYKLCATLVLSDAKEYEGGDILLYFGSTKDLPTPTELRTRGLLYIYPAFRFTQINPVLSGCKYHLDFRFSGPYWR